MEDVVVVVVCFSAKAVPRTCLAKRRWCLRCAASVHPGNSKSENLHI